MRKTIRKRWSSKKGVRGNPHISIHFQYVVTYCGMCLCLVKGTKGFYYLMLSTLNLEKTDRWFWKNCCQETADYNSTGRTSGHEGAGETSASPGKSPHQPPGKGSREGLSLPGRLRPPMFILEKPTNPSFQEKDALTISGNTISFLIFFSFPQRKHTLLR